MVAVYLRDENPQQPVAIFRSQEDAVEYVYHRYGRLTQDLRFKLRPDLEIVEVTSWRIINQ